MKDKVIHLIHFKPYAIEIEDINRLHESKDNYFYMAEKQVPCTATYNI